MGVTGFMRWCWSGIDLLRVLFKNNDESVSWKDPVMGQFAFMG
jgi:hypothetical protein